MALIRQIALAAGLALGLACGGSAYAGGDDYDAAAPSDTGEKGPAYFGFVRDTRGIAIPEARVVLRPKAGEPVVLKANALGLYRSHVSKETRPDDVELICEKEGYKQVRVVRRGLPTSTIIEASCTLQRL